MSGGSGTPTSSNVSSSAPWSPQLQGQLLHAANKANDWANTPANYSVYDGTRVIPFSNQSLSGMNNAQSFAQGAGQNMQTQAGNIINSGGFNSQQNNAMGSFQNAANGGMNTSASQFNDIYGRFSGPSSSQANLSRMASGAMLGGGNPYLQKALTNANERAATGVNDAMSAAGRYGSGAHTDTLAKTLAENSTNALFGQYNQDVSNMMGANSQIDSARLNYGNAQMGAAQGVANTANANADRRLGAAGNLFNAGQQGLGNMSNAYDTGLKPTQTLGQIGGAYEDLAGSYAQEQYDKFNESQNKPIEAIAKSNAIFTGAGALGSTSKDKVYQPTQWGQVGANAAGAALAGK
jgi:hypothetical protein